MKDYAVYRSPIRVLIDLGIQKNDPVDFATLSFEFEKIEKWFVESGRESFEISGKTYSRQNIRSLSEALCTETHLNFHYRIYNRATLLQFLENQDISGIERNYLERFESREQREDFEKLLSPFIAYSIRKILPEIIRSATYSEFIKLRQLIGILSEEDGIYAFKEFNDWYSSLNERLNDPMIDRSEFHENLFIYLRYSPFYELINRVADFYPHLPDLVADSVSIYILGFRKSKNRGDHLLKISEQLQELNCSSFQKETIKSNHKLFRGHTKDSGKTKNIGLWIGIGAAVVFIPILIVVLSSRNSTEPHSLTRSSQGQSYRSSTPSVSRVWQSGFDLNAFKLFHEHTYACVIQENFEDNDFVWDGTPDIKSPLVVSDSGYMQPKGKKVSLINETPSEILMVVLDENSLTAHYVKDHSKIKVHIDPKSYVFFYSGKEWTTDKNIAYDHPYKNIMTDTYTLRYTGMFKQTLPEDEAFLKRMYFLQKGSVNNLKVVEKNGQYVFKDKYSSIREI